MRGVISKRLRLVAVVPVLTLAVLAGCSKDHERPASSGAAQTTPPEETTETTAAPAEESEVAVTGTDFAYAIDGGTTIPAGLVTVSLTNDGAEEHQATIVQFKEGKGMADLAALAEDPASLPEILAAFGGPNAVAPGESVAATQHLEPGEYLFACFIPSPSDGVPHAAKGMLAPVTVEGDAGEPPAEADKRLVLSDYDFGFGDDALLEAGEYDIVNDGPQPHEATIYAPAEGATAQDVVDFFSAASPPAGPPPFVPSGGVAAMDAGRSVRTELVAGEYVFVCFIPDAEDGAPHLAKGMIQIVTVE